MTFPVAVAVAVAVAVIDAVIDAVAVAAATDTTAATSSQVTPVPPTSKITPPPPAGTATAAVIETLVVEVRTAAPGHLRRRDRAVVGEEEAGVAEGAAASQAWPVAQEAEAELR